MYQEALPTIKPDDVLCNHSLFTEQLANLMNGMLFDMHHDTATSIAKCIDEINQNREIIEMCRTFIRDVVDNITDENKAYYCNKMQQKVALMRRKTLQNDKNERQLEKLQKMYTLVRRELRQRGMEMVDECNVDIVEG